MYVRAFNLPVALAWADILWLHVSCPLSLWSDLFVYLFIHLFIYLFICTSNWAMSLILDRQALCLFSHVPNPLPLYFVSELRSCYLCLDWSWTHDLPPSTSQVAGFAGIWSDLIYLMMPTLLVSVILPSHNPDFCFFTILHLVLCLLNLLLL
jgi:hypothetical protein